MPGSTLVSSVSPEMDSLYSLLLLHVGLAAYTVSTILGILAVRRDDRGLLYGARAAFAFALLAHAILIVLIGIEEQRFPVTNLSEAVLFLATILAAGALVFDTLRSMPILTIGTAPVATAVVLLGAGLAARSAGWPAPETLSFWTGLHVLITLAAFGAFALGFVSAVLFLIERRQIKARTRPPLLGMMPSLEGLYRTTIGCVGAGLLLLTAGILVGYLHARNINPGPGWRLDPKILVTTATWFAYAVVMFLSFVPAFRGRRTAIGTTICFLLVAATLWAGVFWSGFHRYM